MKNVKLISLVLSMLVSFFLKAQEKPVSKTDSENNTKTKITTASLTPSKDTISKVKASVNFVQSVTSAPRIIICAPSRNLRKEPLYILDETVIDAKEFSKINPNNIESVKVLKGKEAIALYGNQAADGVIIITTKEVD